MVNKGYHLPQFHCHDAVTVNPDGKCFLKDYNHDSVSKLEEGE